MRAFAIAGTEISPFLIFQRGGCRQVRYRTLAQRILHTVFALVSLPAQSRQQHGMYRSRKWYLPYSDSASTDYTDKEAESRTAHRCFDQCGGGIRNGVGDLLKIHLAPFWVRREATKSGRFGRASWTSRKICEFNADR